MNIVKILVPALLAFFLSTGARAAEDASRFLLTPALMQKFKNAEADFAKEEERRSKKDEDGDDDASGKKKDDSIEGIMKTIERDPRAKALLAKHGISPREYAYSVYAMLHAGMFVAMEAAMDKTGREKLFAGYTKEQKANIALMRTYTAKQKK